MRDYLEFRSRRGVIFGDTALLEQIASLTAQVDVLRAGDPNQLLAAVTKQEDRDMIAADMEESIDREFLRAVFTSTGSGIGKRYTEALYARLIMALGGGFALVVPMLIMVLHPTLLTTLLTTSCFVLAVGVCLAVVMIDSEPKDIIACTAAYAAVLVVFVGAGGGGSGS